MRSRRNKWRKHRRYHAKVRAAERYQLRLTNQDLANIVGMIKNGKAIARIRISQSKSVRLVRYQQKDLVVIYSNKHNEIITVLPKDHKYAKQLKEVACA